jgi:Na+-driven multidrug efflux pump
MTIFENNIINLYSNDKDIRLMVSSLFTITVIYIILDTLVTFTDGVLKGLKYNNYIFKVTTVCGWLIGFSLGHYLSFSYEVIGYLYGISFAYFVMLCLKSYKIYMLIYKKEELEKDLNYDTI